MSPRHNAMLHSERLNVPGYVEIIYSGVRRVGYIFNLKNDLYQGVALCGMRFEAPSVWSVKKKLIPYIESIV